MQKKVALGLIAKNEAPYIVEWVAHHHMLGFDPIHIYDNMSSDETTQICQFLEGIGMITHVMWPNPPVEETDGPQIQAYRHMARHVIADWICFLDADEFLCLEYHDSIQDFVSQECIDGSPVALNWKIYGSSDLVKYEDNLVIDRFRMRGRYHKANELVKTLAPLALLYECRAHLHIHGWPLTTSDCHYVDALGRRIKLHQDCHNSPPQWRGAWINHYILKSREEFERKTKTATPDAAPKDLNKPTRNLENYFKPYDKNEVYDFFAERYVAAVKWRCKNINQRLRINNYQLV